MSVDEPKADEVPGEPAPAAAVTVAPETAPEPVPETVPKTASEAALERYGRRMRRGRNVYFAVIAVVLLALGTTVAVVWSHGEIAHTTLIRANNPAPPLALQTPSATLRTAWRSSERTAVGVPYSGGTVVTYTTDSVRGRNATTGAITWSYTRTDRILCQVVQDEGTAIAIFQVHGNCDQVTALDSSTGERKWTRTLDKDGQPLDGRPAYSVTQFTVMLTTPGVIYAIDPNSGLDRWVYHPDGCTIDAAVIGTQGALISQTCAHPKCDGRKFCGAGRQLLLRDGTAGRSDDAKDKDNPDRIKWNLIGSSAVPVCADQLIAALDPAAGQLQVFDVAKGATLFRLALQGGAASSDGIIAIATTRAEIVWIAGTTYSVALSGATVLWAAATATAPTVTQPLVAPGSTPDLQSATVAVAFPGGIELLAPDTGASTRTFPVAAPPPDSRAYPLGTGFVLAGTQTTVYQ